MNWIFGACFISSWQFTPFVSGDLSVSALEDSSSVFVTNLAVKFSRCIFHRAEPKIVRVCVRFWFIQINCLPYVLSCPIDECGIWQGIVRNAFCCILIRNSLHLAAWGAIFCLALAAPLVVRLAESLKELQEERTRKFKIPHFFSATGRSLNHPFKKGVFLQTLPPVSSKKITGVVHFGGISPRRSCAVPGWRNVVQEQHLHWSCHGRIIYSALGRESFCLWGGKLRKNGFNFRMRATNVTLSACVTYAPFKTSLGALK